MKKTKDRLGRSVIWRGFYKVLAERFGPVPARAVWRQANARVERLQALHPDLDTDSRLMVLPAAALYGALEQHAPGQALPLLRAYGTRVGEHIAGVVRGVTALPGLPELLWRNMPALMRTMSSPEKGYARRIVSETAELVGVDILTCPLHAAAVTLGVPEAAQAVCAMDKAYMTGFRRIRYTRTTSVAEGADCCDYRLRYDREKG